jgi:hypothetical protein
MVLRNGTMKYWQALGVALVGVVAGTPAMAQMKMPMDMSAQTKPEKPSIPAMIADKSKAKSLPLPIEIGMRGYGTRTVDGQTLAEMKSRCVASGAMSAIETARCDQLRRTMKTVPGNTR